MTPLSRSYAQALLESAPAQWDVARFLDAARAILRAIEGDKRLKAFFSTPSVATGVKAKTLEELAGVSQAHDVREGVVEARVTVPAPIGEAERRRLEEALARRVGKKVRMQVDVDPKTLAGFVARVGSNMFDASAAQAIERFRSEARERTGN